MDTASLKDDLDPASETALWSIIDYGTLGADPRKKPLFLEAGLSDLPSPGSWGVGAVPVSLPDADLFDSQSTAARLNEVEYFLNSSPAQNCLL